MKTKLWLFAFPICATGLLACPDFAPSDVCGYPGACLDGTSAEAGDAGVDAPVTCPSGNEPKDDPTCVTDALGVFVAPTPTGNDNNPGTKASPVASITAALTKVGSKKLIFVCEGSYTESADVKSSVSIYGGFKCTDWSYSGTKPKFAGAKVDYVVRLEGVNGISVEDLELDGKDGAANAGETSVGLFVDNSPDVKLARMIIQAGIGSNGAPGTVQSLASQWPAAGALTGNTATGTDGGAANSVTCPGDAGVTTGGKGGNATGFSDGQPGLPALGGGDGGTGGTSSIACTIGMDGKQGLAGSGGAGCTSYGQLADVAWTPGGGVNGGPGGPGQGGGGGGGRDNGVQQGGGGGGGAGGCGGGAGGAGKGGGASLAVVSVTSVVHFVASALTARSAGNGGSGAAGEAGQTIGGLGGTQVAPGCPGGGGGVGGPGGAGGGGSGGLSIGVFYKGTLPDLDPATQSAITVAAKGGNKGVGGNSPSNDGIDGVAQATLECKTPLCQ